MWEVLTEILLAVSQVTFEAAIRPTRAERQRPETRSSIAAIIWFPASGRPGSFCGAGARRLVHRCHFQLAEFQILTRKNVDPRGFASRRPARLRRPSGLRRLERAGDLDAFTATSGDALPSFAAVSL
jgi:hypothetical protein